MADNSKAVFFNLDTLTWTNLVEVTGGGGFASTPSESPFLWTVFFKVDNQSLNQPGGGGSICFFTDGNHGDLGVSSVNPLAVIPIPESLGNISMNVVPLPLFGTVEISAMFGVVAVLMHDGGHVTAKGISAGHDALNQGVQMILNSLVTQAIGQLAAPTQDQINAAVNNSGLSGQVASAVQNAQSFCENVWSLSGKDSQLAHGVVFFNLDAFVGASVTKPINIELSVTPFNTWSITGEVTVTDTCPAAVGAEILNQIFSGISSDGAGTKMQHHRGVPDMQMIVELMRNFREQKGLLRQTRFADWWNIIKTHAPELAYHLGTQKELQNKMMPLVDALASHLKNENEKITRTQVDQLSEVIQLIQQNASCRLRSELGASLLMIKHLEHYTLNDALHALATRKLKKIKK